MKTKKYLSYLLFALFIIPCFSFLTACKKPVETGFVILYNGEDITETRTITLHKGDNPNVEENIVVKVTYSNDTTKIIDRIPEEDGVNEGYVLKRTEENFTTYLEFNYKDFESVMITVVCFQEDANTVEITKVLDKSYDEREVKLTSSDVNCQISEGLHFEYYEKIDNSYQKMQNEFPKNAGQYKVKAIVPAGRYYTESYDEKEFVISKGIAGKNLVGLGRTINGGETLKLKDFVINTLDSDFAWKNPETVVERGEHNYTVVYIPTSELSKRNYDAREFEIKVTLKVKLQAPVLSEIHGGVSWQAISGASYYEYQIDNETPVIVDNTVTKIDTLTAPQTIKVRAIGLSEDFYLNSDYSKTYTFNPTKTELSIPQITPTDFNGENQDAIINNFDENILQFMPGSYNTTQKNAGTYTYYIGIKDKNYYKWNDGTNDTKTIYWTINKINPTVPTVTTLTGTYDENKTLANYVLPANFAWKDSTIVPTCDKTEYTAIYTPTDTNNYNSVEVNVALELEPKVPQFTRPTFETLTSENIEKLEDIVLPSEANGKFVWIVNQTLIPGKNTYDILYIPNNLNYKATSFSVEITYLKAVGLITAKNTVFDNTKQVAPLENYDSTIYTLNEEKSDDLSQTKSGTYNYFFTLDETKYFWADKTSGEKQVSWTIEKRKVSLPKPKQTAYEYENEDILVEWEEGSFDFCTTDYEDNKVYLTFEGQISVYITLLYPEDSVWIDTNTTEVRDIQIDAVNNPFVDIKINGNSIGFYEFTSLETISVGAVLEFTTKSDRIMLINNKSVSSYTVSLDDSSICIQAGRVEGYYPFTKHLNVYLVDKININDSSYQLTLNDSSIEYELKQNENNITVTLDEKYSDLNLYVSYSKDSDYHNDKIQNNSFTINNISDEFYFSICFQNDNNQRTFCYVYVKSFTRIDKIQALYYYDGDSAIQKEEIGRSNGEYPINNFLISGLEITFKNEFENCIYKLLDKNKNIIEDFKILDNLETIYVEIYENGKLVETQIVDYPVASMLHFSFENVISSGINRNLFYLYTNDLSQVSINSYDSNSNMIINNGESLNFESYGIYKVPCVVTVNVNELKFTYNSFVIINYSENVENFMSGSAMITNGNLGGSIYLTTSYQNGSYDYTYALQFLQNAQLSIDSLKEGYTFVSEESDFLRLDNNIFAVKLVFLDSENVKHFSYSYVMVYGKIDNDTTTKSITLEKGLINSSLNVEIENEKIVLNDMDRYYTLNFVLNNEDAQIKVFDSEGKLIFNSIEDDYLRFLKIGIYTLKIIATDGTERSIEITVNGNFYSLSSVTIGENEDSKTLSFDLNEYNFPEGDCTTKPILGAEGEVETIEIYSFFGSEMTKYITTVDNHEKIKITFTSALMGNIFFDSECLQPITANEFLIDIKEDNSRKYFVVYAKLLSDGDCMIVPCYYYLSEKPAKEYPANFEFNGKNYILTLNSSDIYADLMAEKIPDLGDFKMNMNDGYIFVEIDGEITQFTLNLSKTFDDYSYAIFTDSTIDSENKLYDANGNIDRGKVKALVEQGQIYVVDPTTNSVTVPVTMANGVAKIWIFLEGSSNYVEVYIQIAKEYPATITIGEKEYKVDASNDAVNSMNFGDIVADSENQCLKLVVENEASSMTIKTKTAHSDLSYAIITDYEKFLALTQSGTTITKELLDENNIVVYTAGDKQTLSVEVPLNFVNGTATVLVFCEGATDFSQMMPLMITTNK